MNTLVNTQIISNVNKKQMQVLILLLNYCRLFASIGILKRFVKHQLYHNKKLISGKIWTVRKVCIKNVSNLITTCWQLLKLHFSAPNKLDF